MVRGGVADSGAAPWCRRGPPVCTRVSPCYWLGPVVPAGPRRHPACTPPVGESVWADLRRHGVSRMARVRSTRSPGARWRLRRRGQRSQWAPGASGGGGSTLPPDAGRRCPQRNKRDGSELIGGSFPCLVAAGATEGECARPNRGPHGRTGGRTAEQGPARPICWMVRNAGWRAVGQLAANAGQLAGRGNFGGAGSPRPVPRPPRASLTRGRAGPRGRP
jgi:hypothetical protein